MITKTLKLKVIKPINMDWSEFRALINQTSFQAAKFANRIMQIKYIRARDDIEIKSIDDDSEYAKYKESLSSYVRDAINQEVQAHLSGSKWKELMRGDSTLPTFKPQNAIYLRGEKRSNSNYTGFDFYQEEDDIIAELKLRPGRGNERPKLLLATNKIEKKSPGYWQEIEKVAQGKFRKSLCQVIRKNGDIYLAVSYERPEREHDLNPDRIMGIDIGVSTIYCAFNDSLKRKNFYRRAKHILNQKRKIQAQRRELQGYINLPEVQRGHGKKSKFQALEKLTDKWNNFRQTSNHQLSRAIIDYAVKENAGNIYFEDLKGGKDTFLGNDWPVAELLDFIEYKAKEQGIGLKRRNPAYSSQICHSCGHWNREFTFTYRSNIKKEKGYWPKFKCESCGVAVPADYNAAKNIADPDFEDIVKQLLDNRKKKEAKVEGIIEESEMFV